MPLPDLLRVVLLVFSAVSFVVLGDTAGKLMTSAGVAPFFVAWSRFALAAVMLLPFSGLTRAELPALLSWRVLLRAGFIAAGISCILTALRTEPLANVFGAFFIGPVVSYVLAVVFLGERVTARRSLLLGLGLLGVMLVVKPGFGFTAGMGFALTAGCFYGSYLVMTRTVAADHRPRFLLMSQLLIGTVLLAPLGLSVDLPAPSLSLALLVAISAAGSGVGNYLLVIAHRKAEASLIAPLVYSQLISATLLGGLVFGDWPDLWSLAGLLLIATSGLGSLLANRTR
ncbi:Threonine/homoserine efflux transporter RhtA [Pseudooceanicola antarcticus]|uniref:EamA/RhaT family transporter n=1 Tax=Pseudooceanicola antarcticus TaxID=1247613 RepID=A0A285J498_9RHOB|nr:DMT family transporter [Pseudooceanicola antarcticus]PJE29914.1 EamA/RhaT family transporter [Pseudooceanicola antarcticus]SNY53921.1 Threonine/homoserine efflux transporter RhtA [Pseudooceanicola antarcticus]